MCGIVGYVGSDSAQNILLDGLRMLEYRGYDSSGLAVAAHGTLAIRKAVGKLSALENALKAEPMDGSVGIGHTRWATHGEPSSRNAHPHSDQTGRIALVHNGIIENFADLKDRLSRKGVEFVSDTDTEVAAQLVGWHLERLLKLNGQSHKNIFIQAVQHAVREFRGAYAMAIACSLVPDTLICIRKDCPLVLGLGNKETLIASDVPALLGRAKEIIYLEEGDLAIVDDKEVSILADAEKPVIRKAVPLPAEVAAVGKGAYAHFMLKEINDQSQSVRDTLVGRLEQGRLQMGSSPFTAADVEPITQIELIACGTSWHAALIGSYWIEKLTHIPCHATVASEFRYRNPPLGKNTLAVAISQSGETADTLAALRQAKQNNALLLAISNVAGSALIREAGRSLLTRCGSEIGVASTKAFMGQLTALYLLALYLGSHKQTASEDVLEQWARNLSSLPHLITETMACEPHVRRIAERYAKSEHFLFLGRHLNYPIALEGALKLKEVSYIHAEGYPAGEMKHGPIALIDEKMPVVTIATPSVVYDKVVSNLEEVRSRRGQVIAIMARGDKRIVSKATEAIFVPPVAEEISPMINVIPLQLLAYHVALLRGCDVDQPRNLAKSVTVE